MSDGYTRVVRRVADGTAHPPLQGDAEIFPEAYPTLRLDRAIDAGAALQVGCFEILAALRFFSVDIEALIAGGPVLEGHNARQMKFEKLILDWAEADSNLDIASVAIQILGLRAYNNANLTPNYVENTVDKYGAGTVLRKVSHLTCTIQLTAWFAHKDDRSGCAKVLEDNLLGAPTDERSGRHVVVRAYYDRVARYILSSIEYPDTSEQAQANIWELQARLAADIDVVQLVGAPAETERPKVMVEASTSVDP